MTHPAPQGRRRQLVPHGIPFQLDVDEEGGGITGI